MARHLKTSTILGLDKAIDHFVASSEISALHTRGVRYFEPTVGIDVGAKQEIYKLIERLTAQGRGVLLISSYLPEVMGLSDRLIVMAQGRITAEFDSEALKTLTEEEVLRKASIEQ